jgi:hypothetical protein
MVPSNYTLTKLRIFFEIKGRSNAMSYKKKVPHIKRNETKPYNARLILENRAKT